MLTNISKSEVIDSLLQDPSASWSYGAADAIHDWFESYLDDVGDYRIACAFNRNDFRIEWAEYENILAFNIDYHGEDSTPDEHFTLEQLQDRTVVIPCSNTYGDFNKRIVVRGF
tara:strand:- start:59 stop:400 length:342 start_codon:yes stop_codon:yes gene_type:complete